ncbi:nuclear transport factor 2 family protein, partial [Algiphilus sp.]|uniref:nuclear transport factor 2 family protein n=1 Tax=Algiphilus sp. TaxID=1872431 RepID=UPI003C69488E
MSSDWPAEAMLACVRASPEAVAAHDKAAWLGLFADDAEVHDPVGSRGHRGHSAISRFYDTFIARNEIRFEVLAEGACDDIVFRDVVIHTRMGTGLTVAVPAHLRYQLVADDDGALRIRRLDAHWELRRMIGQSLHAGPRG